MKIEHLAIWVFDLEKMKEFYTKYFPMQSNNKYINTEKQFSSYFLSFNNSSCRIELMHRPDVCKAFQTQEIFTGMHHFAISVGSKQNVDILTNKLKEDGYQIVSSPRTTGDGYYESLILDPEGNNVEITI